MRQIYQVVRLASITIQAFTRGWMARKRYKKVGNGTRESFRMMQKQSESWPAIFFLNSQMIEEQKALVLQKYARAWLARRRFQIMRRLVLNVQLSYRVQQLRKKIEEQVKMLSDLFQLGLFMKKT